MKRLLINTSFAMLLLFVASCNQELDPKEKMNQNVQRFCVCLEKMQTGDMLAATDCLDKFSKNNGYATLQEDPEFMVLLKKECPKGAETLNGMISDPTPKPDPNPEEAKKQLLDKTAKEFCTCVQKIIANREEGIACMNALASEIVNLSIEEDELMEVIQETCPEEAHKFKELSRQQDSN